MLKSKVFWITLTIITIALALLFPKNNLIMWWMGHEQYRYSERAELLNSSACTMEKLIIPALAHQQPVLERTRREYETHCNPQTKPFLQSSPLWFSIKDPMQVSDFQYRSMCNGVEQHRACMDIRMTILKREMLESQVYGGHAPIGRKVIDQTSVNRMKNIIRRTDVEPLLAMAVDDENNVRTMSGILLECILGKDLDNVVADHLEKASSVIAKNRLNDVLTETAMRRSGQTTCMWP